MKRFLVALVCVLLVPCVYGAELANGLTAPLLNVPATAAAITVTPVESVANTPIVATLDTAIPEGAVVYGNGWTYSDGVKVITVSPTTQHVWAGVGEHTIKYSGFWVKTQKIKIVDTEGKEQTIESFLGAGLIDTSTNFKVTSDDPDPPDPPDPIPTPGKLSVLLSYEAEDPAQTAMITDPTLRTYLDSHCLVVDSLPSWRFLDLSTDDGSGMPQAWQGAITAAKGKTTPWLIVDNGADKYEGPCPNTAAAIVDKLQQYGGK